LLDIDGSNLILLRGNRPRLSSGRQQCKKWTNSFKCARYFIYSINSVFVAYCVGIMYVLSVDQKHCLDYCGRKQQNTLGDFTF